MRNIFQTRVVEKIETYIFSLCGTSPLV